MGKLDQFSLFFRTLDGPIKSRFFALLSLFFFCSQLGAKALTDVELKAADEAFQIQVDWGLSFAPDDAVKRLSQEAPGLSFDFSKIKEVCGFKAREKTHINLKELQCPAMLDQSPEFGNEVRQRIRELIVQPMLEAGLTSIGPLLDFRELDRQLDNIQFFQFRHGVLTSPRHSNRQTALHFPGGTTGFGRPTVVFNSLFFEFDQERKDNPYLRAALELHEIFGVLGKINDQFYQISLRIWWIALYNKQTDRAIVNQLFKPVLAKMGWREGSGTNVGNGVVSGKRRIGGGGIVQQPSGDRRGSGGDFGEFFYKHSLLQHMMMIYHIPIEIAQAMASTDEGREHHIQVGFRIFEYMESIFDAEIITHDGGLDRKQSRACFSRDHSKMNMGVSRSWFFLENPSQERTTQVQTKIQQLKLGIGFGIRFAEKPSLESLKEIEVKIKEDFESLGTFLSFVFSSNKTFPKHIKEKLDALLESLKSNRDGYALFLYLKILDTKGKVDFLMKAIQDMEVQYLVDHPKLAEMKLGVVELENAIECKLKHEEGEASDVGCCD